MLNIHTLDVQYMSSGCVVNWYILFIDNCVQTTGTTVYRQLVQLRTDNWYNCVQTTGTTGYRQLVQLRTGNWYSCVQTTIWHCITILLLASFSSSPLPLFLSLLSLFLSPSLH